MTLFILIAIVFSALLVLAVIFDGVLDAVNLDFGGDGVLSATTLAAAGAGFGYGGWFAVGGFGASTGVGSLVGIAVAFLVAALAAATVRMIRKVEAPHVTPDEKIGLEGSALTGAEAGDPFEFSLIHRGHPRKLTAVSEVDVAPGQALVVQGIISSSRVRVGRPGSAEADEESTSDPHL